MRREGDLYCNMFTSIKRVIKFGWLSFCRNSGLSFTTIFIMVMAISLITSLFLFHKAGQFFISYLEAKVDISVEFKINTQETEILEIKEELLKLPEVRYVEYISKERALENFIQEHGDDPYLMTGLKEVVKDIPFPFPAILNIRAYEAGQYKQIVKFLEAEQFENIIERKDYYDRKLIIERVFAITSWITQAGIISSLILILIAILITFNTIKLAILNQKEELVIQRLVGASNWFIRGPFLIQGIISGFFAGLISLLIFISVIHFFGHKIEVLLPGFNISVYFFDKIFIIFLGQVAIGMGLGIISSAIAIRKYLKV